MVTDQMRQFNEELIEEVREYRENEKCSTEDAFTNVFSSYVIDAGESFLNPNKNNNGYILTEYTAFKKVMQDVFNELGVSEFKWKRIDMSFNTMDNTYYSNYTKLNRLLIACIANSTNDKNTYDTKNFWNGKTKSLATKNQLREVEFYDKADESNNRSPYYIEKESIAEEQILVRLVICLLAILLYASINPILDLLVWVCPYIEMIVKGKQNTSLQNK